MFTLITDEPDCEWFGIILYDIRRCYNVRLVLIEQTPSHKLISLPQGKSYFDKEVE